MHAHGERPVYYVLDEGIFEEPAYLSGGGHGCPVGSGSSKPPACPSFKFGRMFPRSGRCLPANEWEDLTKGLIELGRRMNGPDKSSNQPPAEEPEDSTIPAGYTYLGQFIAHEITFDNTPDLPMVEPDPANFRSPSLDLDSLYGPDERDQQLYEYYNPTRLKVGKTRPPGELTTALDNDLPRDKDGKALVADPRNDENLAVAQTHVALISFHNKVIDHLQGSHFPADLFECARAQVTKHFQWVVLYDYLPRLVDADVLDCVIRHGPRWFKVKRKEDLFMPLEFSAAAFRFGHSMVRWSYNWNVYHQSAALTDLFDQTEFSGIINEGKPALRTDWVIDWRRFFDFPQGHKPNWPPLNKARKLDTHFDLHLDQVSFNHHGLPEEKRSITVRNLLRGFALGLPTGEEVAQWIGEAPLCPEEVACGPYQAILGTPIFKGKTPLWYYILKEAELNGGSRLGPVGSRIVAETIVGIIRNSRYSILDVPEWYPTYTSRGVPGTKSAEFGMTDLLGFAGVINPIGF